MVWLFYFTIETVNYRSQKLYLMVPIFDTESEIKVLEPTPEYFGPWIRHFIRTDCIKTG